MYNKMAVAVSQCNPLVDHAPFLLHILLLIKLDDIEIMSIPTTSSQGSSENEWEWFVWKGGTYVEVLALQACQFPAVDNVLPTQGNV